MLVLSRKPLQQILVGSEIRITVVRIDRNQVRLGIQAPPGIPILRQELTGKPTMVLGQTSGTGGGSSSAAGLAGKPGAQPSRKRLAKVESPTSPPRHA